MTPDHQERPPFGNPTKARYFLLGFCAALGMHFAIILTIGSARLVAAAFASLLAEPAQEQVVEQHRHSGIAESERPRENASCPVDVNGEKHTNPERIDGDDENENHDLGASGQSRVGLGVAERKHAESGANRNRQSANEFHAESPSRGVIA